MVVLAQGQETLQRERKCQIYREREREEVGERLEYNTRVMQNKLLPGETEWRAPPSRPIIAARENSFSARVNASEGTRGQVERLTNILHAGNAEQAASR